jgi:hypothetical protein
MKNFYEMLGLLDSSLGDKLGLGERGAADFMQLSNGHWAGRVYSGEVFVTKESHPIGQRPDSAFSAFKYQPSRRATAEEREEYNRRHDEFRKTRVDFDPNYDEQNQSKNQVVREDAWDGRVYYGGGEEYDTETKRYRAYHREDESRIEQALHQKLEPELEIMIRRIITDFERNEFPKMGIEPKTTMRRPEVVIRSMTKKAAGRILMQIGETLTK